MVNFSKLLFCLDSICPSCKRSFSLTTGVSIPSSNKNNKCFSIVSCGDCKKFYCEICGDAHERMNEHHRVIYWSPEATISELLSFFPEYKIKRKTINYHCKFGECRQPRGIAVNTQNDIIVADTSSHRIQIFDKEGRFKFQYGERDEKYGQLCYPNRVAVVKTSGDIIVTDEAEHQVQIYNQYGMFVRKFGDDLLRYPRGVAVDNKGRIIVVAKVLRVIIFDQKGTVLEKFDCSKHLTCPNGVAVNDKEEIFICDNGAHCVKVFNYEGVFLRQIGSEGVTIYPVSVTINSAGEILIAHNYKHFYLTIFTPEGLLVSAMESLLKHGRCFDIALMDDGSFVLASNDYHLYIYRYA